MIQSKQSLFLLVFSIKSLSITAIISFQRR